MKAGPLGISKSADLGGRSLYLRGEFSACPFFEGFDFGSGVALALASGAREPALDSLFFSDSFFALDARSRMLGASSDFWDLKSGLRGEDTAG